MFTLKKLKPHLLEIFPAITDYIYSPKGEKMYVKLETTFAAFFALIRNSFAKNSLVVNLTMSCSGVLISTLCRKI